MIARTTRCAILAIFALYFLHSSQAKSVGSNVFSWWREPRQSRLWTPESGDRTDWLDHHGMSQGEWQRTSKKVHRIQELMTLLEDRDQAGSSDGHQTDWLLPVPKKLQLNYPELSDLDVTDGAEDEGEETSAGSKDAIRLDKCITLTEEQADEILKHLELTIYGEDALSHGASRQKRNLFNFNSNAFRKWDSFPIKYKFDGKHTDAEKQVIRDAIAHWEANTCVRFQEVSKDTHVAENHILFTRESAGCHSFIGKVSVKPQQINLQYNCLWVFGIPVHEIGHALGLWHEQQRLDRDSHIRVNWANVDYYKGQFYVQDTMSLGVPYDIGSVMHYAPQDGSNKRLPTMETLDPLYQSSMGQRTGLSFLDAMIINKAYCSSVCSTPLRKSCQYGGYQDPNHCDRCVCPDGYSGQYCDKVAPSVGADCSKEIRVTTRGQVIESPGYGSKGYYDRQECNWRLLAPAGHKVSLRFDGPFGMYCHDQRQCFHWVEVKYAGNLDLPGPRFCCFDTPSAVLLSDKEEMMVTFRANWTTYWNAERTGFRAIIRAEPATGEPDKKTTLQQTHTTTESTVATTTTTAPPPVAGKTVWSCDFEDEANQATWCKMTQGSKDQFDWTLQRGRTPSDETGPEFAYSGLYYIFIEASNPRKQGDTARITSPQLWTKGAHCVSFRYHMFGFHINTLRMLVQHAESLEYPWSIQGQQGTDWFEAKVNVNLSSGDKIGFEGVRGGEFSGDISLDHIRVKTGACD